MFSRFKKTRVIQIFFLFRLNFEVFERMETYSEGGTVCKRDCASENWKRERRREREDCVDWGPNTEGGGHVYKERLK